MNNNFSLNNLKDESEENLLERKSFSDLTNVLNELLIKYKIDYRLIIEYALDKAGYIDENKNVNIDKALDDENWLIRLAAVKSKEFNSKHVNKALNDKIFIIRLAAIESEYFGHEHMEKALNDENEYVRLSAIKSPYFDSRYMDKVLNDENEYVRLAAVKSAYFNSQYINKELNDKSSLVRAAAQKIINKNNTTQNELTKINSLDFEQLEFNF